MTAVIIPFTPSTVIQEFGCSIDNVQYLFTARWNKTDAAPRTVDELPELGAGAWYLDIREESNTPIVFGIKVVLGLFMGRRVNHRLFRSGVLVATDLSCSGREARLDDFGDRVVVSWISTDRVLAMRMMAEFPDPVVLAKVAAAAGG